MTGKIKKKKPLINKESVMISILIVSITYISSLLVQFFVSSMNLMRFLAKDFIIPSFTSSLISYDMKYLSVIIFLFVVSWFTVNFLSLGTKFVIYLMKRTNKLIEGDTKNE